MNKSGNDEIIKLLNCPFEGYSCAGQMDEMNNNLAEAWEYFISKEYSHGFHVLKKAFDSTFILRKDPCKNCARLFRRVIIESCENVTLDLKKMTSGIIKRKKYISDYELAKKVLKDIQEKNV